MLKVITSSPVYFKGKEITGTETTVGADGEIQSSLPGAVKSAGTKGAAAAQATQPKKKGIDKAKGAVKKIGTGAGKVGAFLDNVTTLFSKDNAGDPTPPVPEPEGKKKSNLPVFLAIAGVFLVGTLIYVAVNRKPAKA